jgi:hypothetical protein
MHSCECRSLRVCVVHASCVFGRGASRPPRSLCGAPGNTTAAAAAAAAELANLMLAVVDRPLGCYLRYLRLC